MIDLLNSSTPLLGVLSAWLLYRGLKRLLISIFAPRDAADLRLISAMAFATVPFSFGLLAIVMLSLAPGAGDSAHLAASVALSLGVAAGSLLRKNPQPEGPIGRSRYGAVELVLASLLVGLVVLMVFPAIALPLYENDALEYATVARVLHESRDLRSYPVVDPGNSSGIFAPWTHPPLYVALITQAYILQGSSATPGLMRLIAPWFAVATVALTIALLARHSRRAGLTAAIFVVSAPLFARSVGFAGIDALYVLGLLLAFSPLGLHSATREHQALAVGSFLGLALLTHSQAVIFVPLIGVACLVAWKGQMRHPFVVLRLAALVIVPALTIAGWAYLRNFQILGALISDNPAVFALPSLGWEDYFRLARGYGTPADRVQYGVLKGWFTPTSYGIVFWLFAVGVWLHFRHRTPATEPLRPTIQAALAVIALYYCGVVASTVLGVDLMIRNDRYLSVLLPFVSLFAAFPILVLLERTQSEGKA